MPKYYCDYCDTFLTHDSPSVRKTHNGGRKHKENVRTFYQKWMEDQAQKLVDATAKAFTQGRMNTTGGVSSAAVCPPAVAPPMPMPMPRGPPVIPPVCGPMPRGPPMPFPYPPMGPQGMMMRHGPPFMPARMPM